MQHANNIQKTAGKTVRRLSNNVLFLFLFVVVAYSTTLFAATDVKTDYRETVRLLQEQGFAGVDQALVRFEEIVRQHPDFQPARLAAANGYLLKYEFTETKDSSWLDLAEQHLNRLIDGGGASAEAYFKRALVHLNRNQREPAEGDLRQALSLQPSFPEAHLVYLQLLLAGDRMDEARQNAATWLSRSPDQADTARSFGELFAAADDHQTAATMYEKALTVKPDEPHVRAALGNSYRHLGRYEQAADALTAAIAQLPEQMQLRFALGVCLSELDRPQEAVEQFELYRKNYPQDVAAINNLAVLYEKTGQTGRAKLMWMKVKESASDPDHRQRAETNLLRLLQTAPKGLPQAEEAVATENNTP
ncbi:MAG: tetratricopeptide repeat protein [Desulfofustis sp.]|nr:tetratricopeptide repeat protein [Desulfofustis sp.]